MTTDFLTAAFDRIRIRFLKMGGVDDDIEDSLQEAFCRLWRKRHDIDGLSHAEGLLMKTTRNVMVDSFRKEGRHPPAELTEIADWLHEEPEDETKEIYERVTRIASESLSERDREILFSRDRDGMEFSEIAAATGLTESNVRMIVSRSRKVLREIYKKNGNHG